MERIEDEIGRGLSAFEPVKGRSRSQQFARAGMAPLTLVDDTYNANPDSVRAAIDAHTQDATQIFLPMYYLLLADTEAAQGRWEAAEEAIRTAETIASATGERVWDGQLVARRKNLRATDRSGWIRA